MGGFDGVVGFAEQDLAIVMEDAECEGRMRGVVMR